VRQLLVTARVVPSSPILVNLMMGAILFTKTSVLTRAMRRNISEDGILQTLSSYFQSCVAYLPKAIPQHSYAVIFIPMYSGVSDPVLLLHT
jgi:hypothetical protein